jgi:hypothetical protein
MFGKKKQSNEAAWIEGTADFSGEKGVTMIEQTETITERLRSPADAAKIETMVWLLSKVANEDLDAIWIALLTELREHGYKLQDEPGALLERLKRRF